MVKLKHGAHECVLTSPDIVADGICDMCYKDEPVEFACDTCNFDLCRPCSKIPLKVLHSFHIEHPLEFCARKTDLGPRDNMLCSGCGNLFSEIFYYKCKECEIYLHMSCGTLNNIETSWDVEEKLHYSHAHMLRRCRPGSDARGSCLLCQLPVTPSAICYGCVPCNVFVHECCLDFPREVQHPMHPAHPLIRLDFTYNCGAGRGCNACRNYIKGVPLGCSECGFDLHMRCADSLLRGLLHKSHEHRLCYAATGASHAFSIHSPCQICKGTREMSPAFYYHCVECDLKFHFECLEIPESVVKKSCHVHPLLLTQDDSMDYCGVCETMVHAGHHVYSCKVCDYMGHVDCILHKETPSPLYLKDLYSGGEDVARPLDKEDNDTNKPENKIVVFDIQHNHVLKFCGPTNWHFTPCDMCNEQIDGELWKCETCEFMAHDSCVKMRQPKKYRFHSNHTLTLLPSYPARVIMNCDLCKVQISSFNLFCRICSFIICTKCMVIAKKFLGELHRGQKFIRDEGVKCLEKTHTLVQVLVSRSYSVPCALCTGRLCGNVVTCMECEETYHSGCLEFGRLELDGHPIHSDHRLKLKQTRGSKCFACKLDITKYGFSCESCSISFHFKCIQAVGISRMLKNHMHHLYNFWSDLTRPCTVCSRPCGGSFYGCNHCNFRAHVECTGFPTYVKNQRHQHTVELTCTWWRKICSLCRSRCSNWIYHCVHCNKFFHKECTMSMDVREAGTEEEQLRDIYLTTLERHLVNMYKDTSEIRCYCDISSGNDEEQSDEEDNDSS